MLDLHLAKTALNATRECYSEAAVLQQEIAERLLARLAYIKHQPKTILDLGAKTGFSSHALQDLYPQSQVISFDMAEAILSRDLLGVVGDSHQLPFCANSFDLVFSNLALHYSADLAKTLADCWRVLKPGGLLMLSTLGPDTLYELRASFAKFDQYVHVHDFTDMHNIGDIIVEQHFLDTVMDMEHITLQYDSLNLLFQDLKDTGNQNVHSARVRGLMGKHKWQRLLAHYAQHYALDGIFQVSAEIVYGQAWVAQDKVSISEDGEVAIPISSIKRINR